MNIVILILGAVVLVCWGLAVLFFCLERRSSRHWRTVKEACMEQTVATVIDIKRKRLGVTVNTSSGDRSWFPVYEFYADGQRIKQQSGYGNGIKLFEKGSQVTLYYDPKNPQQIYVPAEKADNIPIFFTIFYIIWGSMGLLVLVTGIFLKCLHVF